MALYQRNGVWWIDILHKGKRIRRTAGTHIKEEAQRYHDQIKHEVWLVKKTNSMPEKTWMDAVLRWLDESGHKRSLSMDKWHLAWVDPYLRTKKLSEITRDTIEEVAKKREETHVSPSTVNRMLEVMRAIFNRACKDWGWIENVPVIRMRKVENKRVRWLTKIEAERLLIELPPHLNAMAAFSLATGLRERNVTKLKWEQISIGRKHAVIHADESKTRRAISVPLNKRALTILTSQKGRHPVYVFTYQGRPVERCNNHAWRKALVRAKIKDFRWHDLRHTWASWHVQSGTPLHELQQLGGWSNYETVLRYAHLSSDHLCAAAERIYDTKLPQLYGLNDTGSGVSP